MNYPARFVFLFLALLVAARLASAANIVVNSSADPANPNTTITVATLGATVTLRDAVNAANNTAGADTITFAPSLAGQTITLAQTGNNEFGIKSALYISSDITIQGLAGDHGVTIDGGGTLRVIYVHNEGNLKLSDLTVSGGSASAGAGVFSYGALRMDRCTLTGNTASGSGGGLGAATPATGTTLVNCTIAGNSAYAGGGIYFGGGNLSNNTASLSLANVTITGNSIGSGSDYGGGIAIQTDTVSITNTVIAGNTQQNGAANDVGDQIGGGGATPNHFTTESNHNLIGTAGHGGLTNGTNGNIIGVADAKLGALAAHGGPTRTVSPAATSPAINAGVADQNIPTDQRGISRVNYGTPDIGAFEYDLPLPDLAVAQDGAAFTDGTSSFTFSGIVKIGSSTSAVTFTISNPSSADLTDLAISKDGANPDDFTVSALSGTSIAVGADPVTFTVQFTAGASGTRTAGLHLASNVPGAKNPFDFTVSGYGNTPPTLTLPTSPVAAAATSSRGAIVSFAISADDVEDGHSLVPESFPASGTLFPVGDTEVGVDVTDTSGVQTNGSFTVHVDPLPNPLPTLITATGADAPGQGTNGLPADAKLASLGPPAIDDDGNVAYLAKWTSAAGSKGTGIFLNAACLAVIGGDASGATGTAGATWKSFTDPVIQSGRLACLAKLGGVPAAKGAMVVSGIAGGTLEKLAQTGDTAPDYAGSLLTGLIFTSFREVGVGSAPYSNTYHESNQTVGFLGTVSGMVGRSKITAAGIWAATHGHFQLILRESDARSGKTIKKLVAFTPGAGSPGQGRGSVYDFTLAASTAVVFYTDGTSGIVAVTSKTFPAADRYDLLTQSGTAGDDRSPQQAGAKFSSFSLPATDGSSLVFLAALQPRAGGVTAATARGIYGGYTEASPLEEIARLGQSAGSTGGNFSVLKDPVLATGGGLAFAATLKGASIKGLAATTIWWRPSSGTLALFAQGGQRPGPDLSPEAQWKSFTSLAIASGRGPIFVGTLVPGPGAVTAKTATGVWACDSDGQPRLLFRTGDPGPTAGVTLTRFTVLNATVGSTGVTRSFNNFGQVVWLATYSDKSQAIIETDIP